MRPLEMSEEFRSIPPEQWPALAAKACRIAISESAVDDEAALDSLRRVELGQYNEERAASMRALADRLDAAAWDTREAGDEARYLQLFRRSRAVSALAFALSQRYDEAIYEAAHAIGTPADLVRRLSLC